MVDAKQPNLWRYMVFPGVGSVVWLIILFVWKSNDEGLSWFRFIIMFLGGACFLFLVTLLVFRIQSGKPVKLAPGERLYHDQLWCNKFLKDKYKNEENLILDSFTATASSYVGSLFAGKNAERVYYHLYRERKVGTKRYVLGIINMEEGLEDMSGFFKVPTQEMPTVSEAGFQKFINEKCETLVKDKYKHRDERLTVRNELEGTERTVERHTPMEEDDDEEEVEVVQK